MIGAEEIDSAGYCIVEEFYLIVIPRGYGNSYNYDPEDFA